MKTFIMYLDMTLALSMGAVGVITVGYLILILLGVVVE